VQVLRPACPCLRQPVHSDHLEDAGVSSTVLLILSHVYQNYLCTKLQAVLAMIVWLFVVSLICCLIRLLIAISDNC